MRIDHLVWYSSDLAQGRRHFASRMDCEPLYGGEHPGEGTANAVLGLGAETYLEILGRDVNQAETSLDPEVRALQGAGLYHWAGWRRRPGGFGGPRRAVWPDGRGPRARRPAEARRQPPRLAVLGPPRA
jgi:hypothetical protein